ncbi:MAG: hypothetical protein MHMPM18_000450 [Marteilia pararefringens]
MSKPVDDGRGEENAFSTPLKRNYSSDDTSCISFTLSVKPKKNRSDSDLNGPYYVMKRKPEKMRRNQRRGVEMGPTVCLDALDGYYGDDELSEI